MRGATHGVLPEQIRKRKSKGTVDEAFCRIVSREYHKIGCVKSFEVCQRGYADPTALSEGVRLARLGLLEQTAGLMRLLSLERWLRSLSQIESHRKRLNASRPGPVQENPNREHVETKES